MLLPKFLLTLACHVQGAAPRIGAVSALTFFTAYLPWLLYQKYYEPPGNRLLKMHLAGAPGVDSRGFIQALLVAYHQNGTTACG